MIVLAAYGQVDLVCRQVWENVALAYLGEPVMSPLGMWARQLVCKWPLCVCVCVLNVFSCTKMFIGNSFKICSSWKNVAELLCEKLTAADIVKIPKQFMQLLGIILKVGFWWVASSQNTTGPVFFKWTVNFEIADVWRQGVLCVEKYFHKCAACTETGGWYFRSLI